MRTARQMARGTRALGVASLLLFLPACATPPPPPPACAPGSAGVPLAYELRAPDGRSAFLQGSVHFARDAQAALDPRATQALREADVLVSEVDMSEVTAMQAGELTLELGRLPEGQRLQDVISPETYALLEERTREAGAPMSLFEQLEPWVVALSFIGVSLVQAGYTPEQGVELQVYGGERPEEIRGLETLADQLGLFDELSPEAQEYMLRDALQPTEKSATELEALFAAWRCGDAAGLEGVLGGMIGGDPVLADFYEATIFERNVSMADGVDELMGEVDRAFIVVGALHLVGARGVPALLEQAGYRIEQLRSAR